MKNKHVDLLEIESLFDIERIANLSVPEKFKLVNFIGLIYLESQYAKQVGLLKLDQSPRSDKNKTYKLFAMLLSSGMKYEMLKRVIVNYAKNFDQSDVYYSQIAILGMGVLLIDKEYDSIAIYNYLIHLLGRDFLTENLKYDGVVAVDEDADLDVSREIEYRPFEGNMRKVKYDILALMKYNYKNGFAATKTLIAEKYDNRDFEFYLNMLDIPCASSRQRIFETYNAQASRMQRLMLNGAYELISGADLFTAHYLFNSIIGKYSRYEKESVEIENEAMQNLAAIEK